MTIEYRLAELERRLGNLLRLGVVEEADYAAARVKVKSGDLVTGWIPWLTRRASNDSDWWAPEEKEQVVLLSPDGDPAQAVALPALYQSAHPAPASVETVRRVKFADGTVIEYDREASRLKADCVGDIEIIAAGNVKFKAARRFEVSAPNITIGDTVIDGNRRDSTLHVHSGVMPGGAVTGPTAS